jgi:hypothetical protein
VTRAPRPGKNGNPSLDDEDEEMEDAGETKMSMK